MHSRSGTSLPLPETVVDAALDVDGEGAMAWNLHGRMGYLAAGLYRCCQRRFDVVHQPVRPNDRLLGLVQGGPHSHQSATRQPGRPCVAKPGVWLAELHRMRCAVRSAYGVYFHGHDFEVVDMHVSFTFGIIRVL